MTKIMAKVKYTNPERPALIDDYAREFFGGGKVFISRTPPKSLAYGAPGECFANCLLAALRSGKYKYCEGIAVMDNEAYLHAWLTDTKERYAYDITWQVRNDAGNVMRVNINALYKGVVISTHAASVLAMTIGIAGVVPNRALSAKVYEWVLKVSKLDKLEKGIR